MSDILRDVVLPKLEGVRQSGGSFSARCPAHDDRNPSLSISVGKEHPVVLHCQAGCDREAILDALGLTWADLCKPREDDRHRQDEWTPRGPAVAVYPYVDEQGALLFQVCRTADKQFPQRRPDPTRKTGWNWKLGDVRRVPYRLPRVIEAVKAGQVVYVAEGEKDVHALEAAGVVATCNPGGAGKWRAEYAEHLREATVIVTADKDDPGRAHARQVAASLEGIAAAVTIAEAADRPGLKDVADHLAAGLALGDLVVTWTSQEPAKVELAPDLWEFIGVEDPPVDWVVPGLLERGDRLVWTGFEGLGKSMFTRQLAVCTAAGIHPFHWGERFGPRRVLLIDCENTERQSRRKFRPLAAASIKARSRVPDGGLRLIHRPEGIDLTRADDAAWLLERVTAHKPDLLLIGPFYRLHNADMNDERAARRVVGVLDAARTKADCALVIEAHAGHGEQGKNRSVRPVGSSLLLRWPEFGYGIAPAEDPPPGEPCRTVHVKPWRGARDERNWPAKLTWGDPNGWPWQIAGQPQPSTPDGAPPGPGEVETWVRRLDEAAIPVDWAADRVRNECANRNLTPLPSFDLLREVTKVRRARSAPTRPGRGRQGALQLVRPADPAPACRDCGSTLDPLFAQDSDRCPVCTAKTGRCPDCGHDLDTQGHEINCVTAP